MQFRIVSFVVSVVSLYGCQKSMEARSSRHSAVDPPHAEASGYLAAMAPIVYTPVIPQCERQRNAPTEQLAPSYFEQMQPCQATLPPQLQVDLEHPHAGSVDDAGDCNLGTIGATEVVCHYHTGFEFTSRDTKPEDPSHTVEVHCIAFKIESGSRVLTPIVFGTQLVCRNGTMPGEHGSVAASEHGGAASCGAGLAGLFEQVDSCDMRCCRNGTLTKAHPGSDVRPSFAVCATPKREVDCSHVLASMHAHAPHRPHDKIGPADLYSAKPSAAAKGRRVARRETIDAEDESPVGRTRAQDDRKELENLDW